MVGEIIAIVGAIGVVGGLYFKLRQSRRDAYPKRVAIYKCTEEFLARAWTDPNADGEALLRDSYHCKSEARFVFNVERHFDLELKLQIEGDDLEFDAREYLEHRCFSSRHWLAEENMQLKDRFAKYLRY